MGMGPGGDSVAVVCDWAPHDTVYAAIDADCDWETTVNTPTSGGPYTIAFVCGKQKLTMEDVVLGEVWLCSGQSNMEFNMKWGVTDAGELPEGKNNAIRFFQVEKEYNKFPQTDGKGKWVVCDEKLVQSFSAVGYFFGRRLNDILRVPVGLIGSYWGGTGIQTWIPSAIFASDLQLQKATEQIEPYGWAPKGASLLYNAMIYPVTPYRIAGVIWYQGEANVADEFDTYAQLFSGMIRGWREAFYENLPLYFVQIAPCSYYNGIKAAFLREQQEMALSLPPIGMVSVADLVDDMTNIHPGRKKAVGERLANLALKEQYGVSDLQPYSPRFSKWTTEKNKAYVSVTSIGKLKCDEPEITNFQLAGADRHFYPATATLKKDGRIELVSSKIENPVAVRYCFTNEATSNLFDVNNLPLLPFRTDKW